MTDIIDNKCLDFTKHLLPAEEMSRMRTYLNSGCQQCAELQGRWEAVCDTAPRERDDAPHESVGTVANAAYSTKAQQPVSGLETWSATLVFDSFVTAGATAGVRSLSSAARHLLYEAGPFTIAVRLDDMGGTSIMIIGQVLETAVEAVSAGYREVSLLRGETTLARTSTNEFGEFQLECERGPDLQICLRLGEQQPIILTLPGQ